MAYGDRRDYRKINLFKRYDCIDGDAWLYVGSTTWSRTCREAEERYYQSKYPTVARRDIKARFAGAGDWRVYGA